MNVRIFLKVKILFLLLILLAVSCTTTQNSYRQEKTTYQKGVWHRIKEGQTLWRIAKTYRISLEEIKEANDIEDVVHIYQGTWIFIPDATKVLFVQGNLLDTKEEIHKLDFIWPVEGEIVKSYGKHKNDFNYGIDLKTNGIQNVVSVLEGVVVLSDTIRGYGNTIIIEHDNDYSSLYSANIVSLVKEGQTVKSNMVIAKTNTVKNSNKAVVHYELFYKGKPVNPLYYLP
ncbi:MAG TPA: LysM peptidoglycan-binding domain-containing protein [Spirochaetes bacterium]|nr:LysM peptidoglycan-binding domain-containing protein [Spirochaetota bacterium]